MSTPEVPPYEIVVIEPFAGTPENWKDLREQSYGVRLDVFHHEQGFPAETEIDDLEDVGTHFLLRLTSGADAGKPIGTIRTSRHTSPSTGEVYYKLSRFTVLKEYRSYKFGVRLVHAMHDYIRADVKKKNLERTAVQTNTNATTNEENVPNAESGTADSDAFIRVVCHSQIYIKGFYARFGYVAEGEEFLEDGAPHQNMVLRLPLEP
ncbi:hypothetical protein QCA50_020146 [Cerrena zonata]|uniref:N-acetyltransferase domain-containing protein n=1 Tax=Cerrena zonata TaxID=2478898 RepID=A0AAW0F848_9APHY